MTEQYQTPQPHIIDLADEIKRANLDVEKTIRLKYSITDGTMIAAAQQECATKAMTKEATAKPTRKHIVQDDDSDDEQDDDISPEQLELFQHLKFFSPDYPLQHPQDDDEPLYCLLDKPYKYIQQTVGLKSLDLLKIIRDSGLSINEAKKRRYRNIQIHALKKQAKLLLEESTKAEAAMKQMIHNILDMLDSQKN